MSRFEIESKYEAFFRAKSSKSFEALYQLLVDELYKYAKAILTDEEYVQDVLTEVFTKLWEKRYDSERISNIKGYLITSVKNKCKDILKSKSYKGKLPPAERDRLLEQLNSSEETPYEVLVYKDLLEKLKMAISEMKGVKKEVFILVKLNGLTYKAVADKLGLNEKTIEKYMKDNLKIYDSYQLPELRKKNRDQKGGNSGTLIVFWALLEEIFNFFNFFSKNRRVNLR
jgi:RNA polymerase sigma-70 factor (ECF subfamily)